MRDDDHGELKTFGRRRGRKPSPRQESLLRDVLPRLTFDTGAPLVANRPVWLEIGFGGGEHLFWQATHNPDVAIIGCEPFEVGVVKLLDQVSQAEASAKPLAKVSIHMGDARDVLRALPDASVDRAFILFPDPWPKRKHQKRRLVAGPTLDLLARVMKPGAELRIGTDIADYVRTMLEAFEQEPRFSWQVSRPADWRQRPADWPQTRYEAKAEREGRQRYYFRFFRV